MKLLLLGATGRVGQVFLDLALADGHEITVLARDPSKIKTNNPNLVIIKADILDAKSVENVFIKHQWEAIVNVVGADPLKPSTLVTTAASILVSLCEKNGISRYLGITGTAEMPKTIGGKISTFILRRTPVGHGVRDHDGAFDIVSKSSLDWFLVGCPWIKDGQAQGIFKRSKVFPGGMRIIFPGDVANRLYDELKNPKYHREVEGIWY